MQQRALASGLTAFSIGLGVALVVAVLVIHAVIDQSFRRGSQGYDLIVGAKGDRLQLVLNTVFHLGDPTDNIPYSYYEKLVQEELSPAVETAIPVCTGHGYKGFPVIATVPGMFDELTYQDGRRYEFAEGRNFLAENPFEAVAGSIAAKKTGLRVGDDFTPAGSMDPSAVDTAHKDEAFRVVGILKHTNTPNDRAIFLNMEGFYQCAAHQHGASFGQKLLSSPDAVKPGEEQTPHQGEAQPEAAADDGDDHDNHHDQTEAGDGEQAPADDHDHGHDGEHQERQITAVLVCTDLSRPELGMALPEVINAGTEAQAVHPAKIIYELFDGIVGNVQMLLLLLAVLVVVVAGIGILVSIYNSMSERRHEIAVMRALGAGRVTVMAIILTESILLSLGGGLVGLLLGHGLIGVLSPTIADQTGVLVSPLEFQLVELILIPGLILLATLVGFLPALSAYRTDVAKALIAAP
jgi:putative ABC transport system permease protein